jgi:uncharacterized protein
MAQTRVAHPVRWRGVLIFLLLAFGLAWIPFLALQPSSTSTVAVLILLLQFSPAIAAVLVRGPLLREGFADSGLRLNLSRRSLTTYGFALLLLPLVFVGAILFGLGLHLATWAPQTSQTNGVSIVLAPVTFGEEFGWRGYLLPGLMPLGQNWAILLSGVIWAAWHLPLNLLYGANRGLLGFPFFLVWTIGWGAVLGWLRLRAQSVWPAAIMHAQVNVIPRLEGVLLALGPTDPVAVIGQVALILIGLGLALRGSLTYWWLRQETAGVNKPA